MIKYKRRAINQKADLHDHEYITYEDALETMMSIVNYAVEVGADESKLMEFFDVEET